MKRKKKIRVNEYTGQQRKWVCTNCRWIDEALKMVEAQYELYLGRDIPVPIMARIITEAEKTAKSVRRRLRKALSDDAPTLTPAQLRYCELEEIPPEEFLARIKR